jgi:hypothetical protein
MLPLGVEAILVLEVDGVLVALLRLGLRVHLADLTEVHAEVPARAAGTFEAMLFFRKVQPARRFASGIKAGLLWTYRTPHWSRPYWAHHQPAG